mgnify:CR=1 FL=1
MKPHEPIGAQARLRSLLAVLQLASPALPVGGFAYSQGLESAIEDRIVVDESSAGRWIGDALMLVVARLEAPLWLRAHDAAARADHAGFARVNAELLASRETRELRDETRQMGVSMLRVYPALNILPPTVGSRGIAYPAAFAWACAALGVDREAGLAAYLWAWFENQVLAAVKTVPLGQMAGQRLLATGHTSITRAIEIAGALGDEALGTCAVQFAVTCARHEAQYSRLFRS